MLARTFHARDHERARPRHARPRRSAGRVIRSRPRWSSSASEVAAHVRHRWHRSPGRRGRSICPLLAHMARGTRPSRARRRGAHGRRDRRPLSQAAIDHRPGDRPAADDASISVDGRVQRRDLQLHRAARRAEATRAGSSDDVGHRSHPRACTRSTARTAFRRSTGCSPSCCTIGTAGASSRRAITSGSSRCTTVPTIGAWSSPPRSRRCCGTPTSSRAPDRDALRDYLTFQFVIGEATLFAGIRKVLPGHYQVSSTSSPARSRTARYWEPRFQIDPYHTEEYFVSRGASPAGRRRAACRCEATCRSARI